MVWKFEAIGTVWEITIGQQLADGDLKQLQHIIQDRIEEFDRCYSRFRSDSLVTAMSRHAGTYTLPDDAGRLIDFYRSIYDSTDGLVTPLIGTTLSDAGYDANYSLHPSRLSRPAGWDDVMYYRPPELHLIMPLLLDFGAAGKGYLVDIVCDILLAEGLTEFIVDAGGDMRQYSMRGQNVRVALEHPIDPEMAVGTAIIQNRSICGSAGNRRSWDKYTHIIDPLTLESPRHILALWVVADSALVADGLATALFFVPADRLSARYDFQYAIMNADHSLHHSPDFPAEFYTTGMI